MKAICSRPPVYHARPREISDLELGQYMNSIMPGVYSEVYGLPSSTRHQILCAVRDELSRWGGLNQSEIDRRVAAGYK